MTDSQTSSNASVSGERFDHIVRVRTLVWSLKESLSVSFGHFMLLCRSSVLN